MRVAFSECAPNYETHLAPYQVLGFLDDGESPATAFGHGMLPSNRDLTRFYLARSVRIDLGKYTEGKRERYVRKQCASLRREFLPRGQLELLDDWVDMSVRYMNESPRWASQRKRLFEAEDVLARLDVPMTTHLLTLTDTSNGLPAALAMLYVEPPVAYYARAFYDFKYRDLSIGSYLMSCAINEMQCQGLSHVYLGTCYYEGARYKTRFAGMEFFDGLGWSGDRERLRFLLSQQDDLHDQHLFDHPSYLAAGPPLRSEDATTQLVDLSDSRCADSTEER